MLISFWKLNLGQMLLFFLNSKCLAEGCVLHCWQLFHLLPFNCTGDLQISSETKKGSTFWNTCYQSSPAWPQEFLLFSVTPLHKDLDTQEHWVHTVPSAQTFSVASRGRTEKSHIEHMQPTYPQGFKHVSLTLASSKHLTWFPWSSIPPTSPASSFPRAQPLEGIKIWLFFLDLCSLEPYPWYITANQAAACLLWIFWEVITLPIHHQVELIQAIFLIHGLAHSIAIFHGIWYFAIIIVSPFEDSDKGHQDIFSN